MEYIITIMCDREIGDYLEGIKIGRHAILHESGDISSELY